jgi:four helix bundle protein
MKTFKDLKVWQKAHSLTLDIYKLTQSFPCEEKFGLVSQLRRSVSSIPTNIVEGFKRRSKKDFAHFINIAESSLEETKYNILLSYDLNYLKKTK